MGRKLPTFAARMKEKEKIFIGQALQAFLKYGIKSMTMDDLARHLGMSKKTIYNYVKDKNELVERSLAMQFNTEECAVSVICAKNLNAIDEMFEIGLFISGMLNEMHPSIHYDLEKYHAEAFHKAKKSHEEHIYKCTVENLKKGMSEGLYREDLNAEVIAKIYMTKIDVVFNAELFPPTEISFNEVYSTMFRYHILGVASMKGATYLKKKLKSSNTITL